MSTVTSVIATVPVSIWTEYDSHLAGPTDIWVELDETMIAYANVDPRTADGGIDLARADLDSAIVRLNQCVAEYFTKHGLVKPEQFK
jgi:hypothetical protein